MYHTKYKTMVFLKILLKKPIEFWNYSFLGDYGFFYKPHTKIYSTDKKCLLYLG